MRKLKIDINDIIHTYSGRLYIDSFDSIKTKIDKYGVKHTYFYYKCICTCKNKTVKIIERNHLIGKHIKSCGCLQSEKSKENVKYAAMASISHNMSRTRFYKIWSQIKIRCNNINCEAYPNYGGRGITYDPRWENFEEFYIDMYESYIDRANEVGGEQYISIDRINVNGNYYKENCKWSTDKEQCNNKRDTIIVNYNNIDYPCSKLYDLLKENINSTISKSIFRRRIKSGYYVENAISKPVRKITNQIYVYRNKEYSILDLLNLFCDRNINYSILYNRLTMNNNYSECIQNNIITDNRIFLDEKSRSNLYKPIRIIDSNKENNYE